MVVELGSGPLTIGVGEERVVAYPSGQHPFAHADDDDQLELEPHDRADGTDEDTLTEATDAAEVVVELVVEGSREAPEVARWVDGVDLSQALEDLIDPVGRRLLRRRPLRARPLASEHVAQHALRPRGQGRPRGERATLLELTREPLDKREELFGVVGHMPLVLRSGARVGIGLQRVGAVAGVGRKPVQPIAPLVKAFHDARLARHALPSRRGNHRPAFAAHRAGREQFENRTGGGSGERAAPAGVGACDRPPARQGVGRPHRSTESTPR